MAIYRLSVHIIKRSAGRSATAAAAYRSGERIEDSRSGLVFDYRRRGGVEKSEIIAPKNAPAWAHERGALWNRAELAEKRKDAQVAREIVLSLPHEMTDAQRHELLTGYVREQFADKGMVADVSIHDPDREGDDRNHHAHILLTMRKLDGDGFGGKERAWNEKAQIEIWREQWAGHQNRAFEKLGLDCRVDHRSLEAQGINREPEPKLGPVVSTLERRGVQTDRGNERREVIARNVERDELQKEYEVLCRKLGLDPELVRSGDPAKVASRADPARKKARMERFRRKNIGREKEKQRIGEWESLREETTGKPKKGKGKVQGGRGGTGGPKRTSAEKEARKTQRDAARERVRERGRGRNRDFEPGM